MMVNTCLCCGDVVPEGRQVCPACERRFDNAFETPDFISGFAKGYKAGIKIFYELSSATNDKRVLKHIEKAKAKLDEIWK